MLGKEQAMEILEKALSYSEADQTQVTIGVADTSLTRFAGNVIHQNVAEVDADIQVKAVIGKKIGYASANTLDEAGIRATVEKAVLFARHQVENPDFVSLPDPTPIVDVDTFSERTANYTPEERAQNISQIVGIAKENGIEASGAFSTGQSEVAIANSLGIRAYNRSTGSKITTVMSGQGGFGYADRIGRDASVFDFRAIGQEAAERAVKSRNPEAVEPGEYEVVLMPYAVDEFLGFLDYTGFGALAYQEGRSFMSGKLGQKICGENINIWDDGLDPRGMVHSFDSEGTAKQRVDLIKNGVANAVVYDSYTAKREGKKSTGHAYGTGIWGPSCSNLFLAPGDSTVEEMIDRTKYGILVTRFHYTNVVHPMQTIMTGMTRDGTFLIENGKISKPLKNLRFTQSILGALSEVEAISKNLKCEGTATVPAIKVKKFNFSGVTEF